MNNIYCDIPKWGGGVQAPLIPGTVRLSRMVTARYSVVETFKVGLGAEKKKKGKVLGTAPFSWPHVILVLEWR